MHGVCTMRRIGSDGLLAAATRERGDLAIEQPRPDERHERPTDRFDPAFGRVDLDTRCVERNRKEADNRDGRERLNEGRQK